MRLWSIHPKYLDPKGLVALWREGLLAQKVLSGDTRGYRQHSQLRRFRESRDPLASIGSYLQAVADEARGRGYAFDTAKICAPPGVTGPGPAVAIPVKAGQLTYELEWLRRKLRERSPQYLEGLREVVEPEPHPIFIRTDGGIEDWERVK